MTTRDVRANVLKSDAQIASLISYVKQGAAEPYIVVQEKLELRQPSSVQFRFSFHSLSSRGRDSLESEP